MKENITKIKSVLTGNFIGKNVTVAGWARTRRDSKAGFSFIELNDGSIFHNLQIIAPNTLSNYESEVKKVITGACIEASGEIKKSQGKGQSVELLADNIFVHGFVDNDYPMHKQRMSFEHLREHAHLRPRTNTFGAVTRVRNSVAMSIHNFFQSRGFLWIATPIITSSDCEGAGEMFNITTLDLNSIPKNDENKVDYNKDFFKKPAKLTVSGQLNVENYACALGNVYTFGPTFRAENSNTSRHLAEFWMVEPEMAFADLNDNIDLAENFVKFVINSTLKNCPDDMQFFNKRIQPGLIEALENITACDFARVTYTDAIEMIKNSGNNWEFSINWGDDLQAEHEHYLTEQVFKKPVFVYDWPAKIKPFYMRLNDDEQTVCAMDLLVPRFGEIIGGSQREERIDLLDKRIDEQNMNKNDYYWYRDLRRFGSVPHSGFGLGFERLMLLITGLTNVRDVIPFPRTPGNLHF